MRQEFDAVGRGYWNCPNLDKKKSSGDTDGPDTEFREPSELASEANLISSKCVDGLHRPVLDLDLPARYVPSSTKGHGHLYIDHPLTWEQYEQVLVVLGEVGILEKGYVGAAIHRQATFVRPEWVRKPDKETSVTPPRNPKKSKVGVFSAVLCEHANEVPQWCPCSTDCYCRSHTCGS